MYFEVIRLNSHYQNSCDRLPARPPESRPPGYYYSFVPKLKKSYNSLYAISESCKMYRCANNIIYILISFIILNHPKSFFIIFLYFNEINCIFWEYFIDLLLQRRHYFRLSIGLLQMYSLVYIPNSFVSQ